MISSQVGLPGLAFLDEGSTAVDVRQNWQLCPPLTAPWTTVAAPTIEVRPL